MIGARKVKYTFSSLESLRKKFILYSKTHGSTLEKKKYMEAVRNANCPWTCQLPMDKCIFRPMGKCKQGLYVFLNLCCVTTLNVVLHECSYALLVAVLS
jgi:hypothetical protein